VIPQIPKYRVDVTDPHRVNKGLKCLFVGLRSGDEGGLLGTDNYMRSERP